ncbi:MAG: phosphomannomutase/phosphoglucomutase [Acidimicrobiia bacterium]|nr:phosphomannomutase/phosphoglucomutase [Acidimicrobiia bacterium]MXZ79432.1 phosphomannomutase/phosphoglucomutase [Acidimicrobiia bacterium]MXZ86900.1 phosphomannomutase/phosphoglucomutase [Acidimicrobiia bacterium]MYB72521.1 phosphomannomutase/phosphoglucomutase [Acidimicrobiia bacterium]MYE73213.1 phosphomannomutase/phosphoglucomutase [Acidimicrobiia bacterium]
MATDYDAIFKAYDIRGTVGDQIDADGARAIGGAFARFVASSGAEAVLVGRDMRPEGEEFAAAFGDGVMGHGIDVVDVGLCATDMLYYASGSLGLPGAVFTASHNPAGYNGIKMCGAGATPIGADTGLGPIKAMAISGPEPAAAKGTRTSRDLLDDYVAHVCSFVDVDALAPLLVVADTANGMGGLVVPAVFDGLPFTLDLLYPELDGTFPNHPADPLQPENLRDLQDRVLAVDANVGMAFDGDADRMFLVDENARPVSGSLTTAIIARAILERDPGATIIHNLICSRTVPEVIAEGGGTAVRTRVGHTIIKQAMAETGAVFGGEHSGHYYFRDNYRADSGLIAALMVLESLSRHPAGLSDLVSDLDRYAASGELNTKVVDAAAVIERVAASFPDARQDRLDGLTVDLGDWWFNLRPSNTEPLLRLNLEAPTPDEVEERVAEVQAHIA